MRYYVIHQNRIYIADTENALSRYYDEEIKILPNDYIAGKYIVVDGVLVDNTEQYEEQQKQQRIDRFNAEFFNTSLGYIRRAVNMKDGSHKDFLSDLLPTISMAVQMGQEVKVIAYDMPDFDYEVIDWEQYQHNETVTPQFIQECFLQLSVDFGVVNEAVEENNI